LKDHALLGGRVLKIYKNVNKTLGLPQQELCRTKFHFYGNPGIDIESEDGRS
jgi:hypothetical protein